MVKWLDIVLDQHADLNFLHSQISQSQTSQWFPLCVISLICFQRSYQGCHLIVMRHDLTIGLVVNHAACDGAPMMRFLHTWSAAFTGTVGPPPPVLDRTLMVIASLYENFLEAVLSDDEMEHVNISHDELLATFMLSMGDLQRIKQVVAREATRRGAASPRCSSFVATIGFIWSCHQQATDGANNGDPTYILFPMDHRSRRKPPIPDEYLGNCIGAAMHAAPKDQLAVAGAGGLFTACTAVAAAIEEAVGGIESFELDFSMERVREAIAAGALTVAGSPRFRVYGVDLGFGRPTKVEIVSVAKTGAGSKKKKTGAVSVAQNRNRAGGMEVGISLPTAGMKRFQKCFADAIALLSHVSEHVSAKTVGT